MIGNAPPGAIVNAAPIATGTTAFVAIGNATSVDIPDAAPIAAAG
jgi:hypothetical protein